MPKSPSVPNIQPASQTIAQSQAANLDTLHSTQAAQNLNQKTAYGTLDYSQNGVDQYGNPLYTASSTLSPEQQAILNQLQGSQTSIGGAGGNLADASSSMYSAPPDFSEAAGTQTSKNMERQLSYLSPYFEQQTQQLDNQLRNQGLFPGTEAYDRAMRTVRDNQNQSVMSFLNQTQPIAFQQAQSQYTQPLDTLSKILGLTQPANLAQQFVRTPTPTAPTTDVGGIVSSTNQANMEAYKAQLAQSNAMMSGMFGIGGSLVGGPIGGMLGSSMFGGAPKTGIS